MTSPKNSTILITGGSGFIGFHLISALQSQGYTIRILQRSGQPLNFPNCEYFEQDITLDGDFRKIMNGVDAVIHLAGRAHKKDSQNEHNFEEFFSTNVVGTRNIANHAVSAKVKRFIFLSTVKVNGEETRRDHQFNASDPPEPEDMYAITKHQAEIELMNLTKSSGMDFVIIRPPLVYGPGVKGNFLHLIRGVSSGLLWPLGSVKNKRSLVAIDNLIDLIIVCITHPLAANEVFLISDDQDISTPYLLKCIGEALSKRVRLFSVPVPWLLMIAGLVGKREVMRRVCMSLQVDISKTKNILGWTPIITFEDAIKKTAVRHK